MHPPRAILFDMDDTLISAYRRPLVAWGKVAREFQTKLGGENPDALAILITERAKSFWADAGRHRKWRQSLAEARRLIVAESLPGHSSKLTNAIADRFSVLRDEEMHLFEGAIDVLEHFRGRGVRLALITNGDRQTQRAKITRFALEPHFDHIQIEGEHGFGKPEERAYRHALATLNVAPADTWMVGDHLEWEVAAPKRLGIYTIWHDSEHAGLPDDAPAEPDRIITSLPQLLQR